MQKTEKVEKVEVNTRQWESKHMGKVFQVDYVTMSDGVRYEYNRLENYAPFIVGTEVSFSAEKNQFGKDKMSGAKIVTKAGQGGVDRPRQSGGSAPAPAARLTAQDIRIAALTSALGYYTTYKKPSTAPEDVVALASRFEVWITSGSKKAEPSPAVQENTAPPAPETPASNDTDDDLPF